MNAIEPLLEELGFEPHPDYGLDAAVLRLGDVTIRAAPWVTGYELRGRARDKDGLRDECLTLPHSPTREELHLGVYRLFRSLRPRGPVPNRLHHGAFLDFMKRTLRGHVLEASVDHDLYRAALRHLHEAFDPIAPGALRFQFDAGQMRIQQRASVVLVPARGQWFGEVSIEGWSLETLILCRHRAARPVPIAYHVERRHLVVGSRSIPACWHDTD